MKSFIPIDDLHDPMGNKGVCHNNVALPFTFKSILRQNKNDGNTQIIFHHVLKIIIFKKIL
jgi:hypothetical protein